MREPRTPGRSLREPTSYTGPTETTGVEWSSDIDDAQRVRQGEASNAMRPACAESTPGMSSSKTTIGAWVQGSTGKRESVGFEDSLLLLFRKRQGQELIDVLPEVFSRPGWARSVPRARAR